jgi:hypothetical protein
MLSAHILYIHFILLLSFSSTAKTTATTKQARREDTSTRWKNNHHAYLYDCATKKGDQPLFVRLFVRRRRGMTAN